MLFRRFITVSIGLLAGLVACQKTTPMPCAPGLHSATVLHGRNQCDQNGYVLQLDGGASYPPDSLPPSLQQSGLRVCVAYTTYEDLRMCACCGGTRMKIQQIQRQ